MAERERPPVVEGDTYELQTGCGSLFLTVNSVDGTIFEIFGNLGKAGGCPSAMMQSLGRVCSKAIRYGVPPDELHKTLRGIGCHLPGGFHPKFGSIKSCADAFGMALEMALDKQKDGTPCDQ